MEQMFVDKMKAGARELGISLTDLQIEQFYHYYELLTEWNKVMNLTAITEMGEVVTKHFLDSLSLVRAAAEFGEKTATVIDVGTGAGFPGIPLKIAFPQLQMTLLDSLNKRVNFLNTVIGELGLTDITAIHGRAEDVGKNSQHRENYDLSVSRAVANIATLSEYCIPLVKEGGLFISYKSGKIDEELKMGAKAISVLGGKIKDTVRFQLQDGEGDRSLVMIKKVGKTPKKYPRKAGLPGKEPIA